MLPSGQAPPASEVRQVNPKLPPPRTLLSWQQMADQAMTTHPPAPREALKQDSVPLYSKNKGEKELILCLLNSVKSYQVDNAF